MLQEVTDMVVRSSKRVGVFNLKFLLTNLTMKHTLPAPKWNIAVVGRAARECVSEAEQLPREGWAMRGTASMPEALLRARQLLPMHQVYAM